jgi:hypothetical protein
MKRLPEFSRAAWYLDRTDARCPLDATLEAVEIQPPARGKSGRANITLRLLAANRATQLVFRYTGVVHRALTCYTCDQGMGAWLRDEFTTSTKAITHRITWRSAAGATTQWLIEAERVTCAANRSATPSRAHK